MNAAAATQQLFEFLVLKQSKGALKMIMHSLLSLPKIVYSCYKKVWSLGINARSVTDFRGGHTSSCVMLRATRLGKRPG